MIFAYIDPGTGSLLLQAVLGGVAGLAVFFRTFGRRLLRRHPRTSAPAESTSADA
ncbi:MAG: hypothetical protein ACT4OP_11325 [Actinomycetota bacterium]